MFICVVLHFLWIFIIIMWHKIVSLRILVEYHHFSKAIVSANYWECHRVTYISSIHLRLIMSAMEVLLVV